jgi:hypothetical protein
LITCINLAPSGYQDGINLLLQAGADPFFEVAFSPEDADLNYSPAQWAAIYNQVDSL